MLNLLISAQFLQDLPPAVQDAIAVSKGGSGAGSGGQEGLGHVDQVTVLAAAVLLIAREKIKQIAARYSHV